MGLPASATKEVVRFAMSDITTQQQRVISGAQNATRILSTGSAVALIVVAAKLLISSPTIHISGLVITVGSAWILFAALTAANIFVSIFLTLEIRAYLASLPAAPDLGHAFNEITSSRNPFVHGLLSRATPRRPSGRYYPMRWSDPSTWVAYAAAALLVAALLPWKLTTNGVRWEKGFVLWSLVILAVLIPVLNWWAGGIWMIDLSRLGDLAAWVDALPDGPVTNEDLSTLVKLAAPAVYEESLLPNQSYYEVANFLNRLMVNPATFSHKPIFGIKRRPKYRYDLSNETLWREINNIYSYFRTNLPQLIVSGEPWFVSSDNLKVTTKRTRSAILRERKKRETRERRDRGYWHLS